MDFSLSEIGNRAQISNTQSKFKQKTNKQNHSCKRVFLTSYHVLLLQKLPEAERAHRSECVFWDVSKAVGQGGWSGEGCQYHKTLEGRDVCVCDHLTNFAVLLVTRTHTRARALKLNYTQSRAGAPTPHHSARVRERG